MKNIKRVAASALSLALAASVVAVTPATNVDAAKASVVITKPTKKAKYTQKAKTKDLKWTVKNGTVKSVKVTSSKKAVVAVSKVTKNGAKLTTKTNGTAKITVKVTLTNGKTVKDTLKVTVKNKVSKLTASMAKTSSQVNGYWIIPKGTKRSVTLTYKAKGNTAVGSKAVKADSSKKAVATVSVSKKNVVTIKGVKAGKATITITSKDGSNKKATVKVQVVKAKQAIAANLDKATIGLGELGREVPETATINVTQGVMGNNKFAPAAFAEDGKTASDVVTVEGGVVTAVKAGKAIVRVYNQTGDKSVDLPIEVTAATGSKAKFTAKSTATLTVKSADAEAFLTKFEAAAKAAPAQFKDLADLKLTVDSVPYVVTVDEKGVITYKKNGKVVAADTVKANAKKAATSKTEKVAALEIPATADKVPALVSTLQAASFLADGFAKTVKLESADKKTVVEYTKVTVKADYVTLEGSVVAADGKKTATTTKLYAIDNQLYVTSAADAKALVDAKILTLE